MQIQTPHSLKSKQRLIACCLLIFWRCESEESNWGAKEELLRKLWLTFKDPLGWGQAREVYHLEPESSWVLVDSTWSKPSKPTDWKYWQALLVAHCKNE